MNAHPIQALAPDEHGTLRFKENKIVRHLLDWAKEKGHGLNELAMLDFPQEDWEQFAQLIGYSFSGFQELSYVTGDTITAASVMEASGCTSREAKEAARDVALAEARGATRKLVGVLFSNHPNDLKV